MSGNYNGNNVVTALASVFIQPYNASVPAVLPPSTTEYGGDWSNGGALPWQTLGATDQGWSLHVTTKTSEITIEEQSTPVDVLADSKAVSVSGNLSEDLLQNLLWAYGGGTLQNIAATGSTPGMQVLTLQDALAKWAIGVETVNANGFYRRWLLPKGVIASDTQTAFRRAAQQHMYPFSFATICPVSQIQITDKLTPHT